jgi:hypothetical protein
MFTARVGGRLGMYRLSSSCALQAPLKASMELASVDKRNTYRSNDFPMPVKNRQV